MQPEDELDFKWTTEEIRKPHESFYHKYWKKIFIASCLCALLVDPLFLYIPILKDDIKCLMLDPKLKICVLILRSVTDFFYLVDIIIRLYNCSCLVNEHNGIQQWMSFVWKSIRALWASSDILIEIVAVLPLPQVAILIFFSKMSDLRSLTTRRMVIMNVLALLQYVPRVLRIYLSFKELKRTPKKEITETPLWLKGVLNFAMYIIVSHVFGAVWYFFAIQRMMICWHSACRKDDGCDNRIFSCHDHHAFRNTTILNDLCSVSIDPSDTMLFDFGIFAIVLQSGIVGSTNYFQKFLKCFWWGLQNLSSFGSNLGTSVDGWENLFTVFISIIGLLMFLYLIGNLQLEFKKKEKEQIVFLPHRPNPVIPSKMYMQFETSRTEDRKHKLKMKRKRKEKSREIDLLLFRNGIPTRSIKDIKLLIMEKVQQGLEAHMDTKWDNIIPLLPSEIQRHMTESLSLTMLKDVRMLDGMDEGVLKKLHQQLEPVKYENNTDIIQKGEPLEKMLFIVDGDVSIENRSYDSDDSLRGKVRLCGEELLRWPFHTSFPHKPLATESVKAVGVVEALFLKACVLENIYNRQELVRNEAQRHRRMMKVEMGRHIGGLMPKNGIPKRSNEEIKSRILEDQFQEGKDVYWDNVYIDWYNLVSLLPSELQNEIKSYMPLTKLKKMRAFQNMEESVLKEICRHLQPMMYYNTEGNIIERGDPIQMFYIMDGTIGHNGWGKIAGEFYGEELLVWPFSISFPDTVPKAAESFFAATDDVEALVLTASDMKSVATEFRKHFIKNFGRLVKNLVNYVSPVGTTPASSSSEAVVKFFTEEELKEATGNYTCDNYADEGGYGTVYEATLHGRRVAIKTCNSTTGDQYIQSQRLVQEAFVLSQIRHKNVVRLLGCCLEAKWPLMVYDRTYSSTLFNHIHINEPKLSLELRLNIAAETARALAYLHFRSVIHRDVKTANILIDHATYTARVSGFGASRLLHEDELSTLPVTSEYSDPEYLKSNVLTEKSEDVYSFGIVLVELLTCQQADSSDRPERSLAVQQGHLDQILDGNVIEDKFTSETAKEVSKLAVRCLSSRETEGPSMEEVAEELEGLANYYTVESKTGFSPPRS